MSEENRSFKNVYVINMEQLLNKPLTFMPNGTVLPIEKKNGKTVTDQIPKLFSERFVKKMIKEYPNLSDIIGVVSARTVIEYLDQDGAPVLTLYPTNDTDLHKNDWTRLDSRVLPEVQHIIERRQRQINMYKLSHKK